MTRAYWGRGSVAVIFPEVVSPGNLPENLLVPTLNLEAAAAFQQGCDSYRVGQYRRSVTQFSQAVQLDPELAEAYHNRGRAIANLRRITDAVAEFIKASDRYSQQDNRVGLAQIKQDLAILKGFDR